MTSHDEKSRLSIKISNYTISTFIAYYLEIPFYIVFICTDASMNVCLKKKKKIINDSNIYSNCDLFLFGSTSIETVYVIENSLIKKFTSRKMIKIYEIFPYLVGCEGR